MRVDVGEFEADTVVFWENTGETIGTQPRLRVTIPSVPTAPPRTAYNTHWACAPSATSRAGSSLIRRPTPARTPPPPRRFPPWASSPVPRGFSPTASVWRALTPSPTFARCSASFYTAWSGASPSARRGDPPLCPRPRARRAASAARTASSWLTTRRARRAARRAPGALARRPTASPATTGHAGHRRRDQHHDAPRTRRLVPCRPAVERRRGRRVSDRVLPLEQNCEPATRTARAVRRRRRTASPAKRTFTRAPSTINASAWPMRRAAWR